MYILCRLIYILVLFIVFVIAADAEVITLMKNNIITCVTTGSDANAAIFVNPPTYSVFVKETQEINRWIYDDWKNTNSTSSNQQAVTDERWEDFKISDETMGHMLPNNPVSISICHSGSMTITVLDETFLNETSMNFTESHMTDQRTSSTKNCQWFHYSLMKIDNSIRLISEYGQDLQEYKLSFNPFWIYFTDSSSDHTFWKLHDYNFRSSDTVTTGQESAVEISFTENRCLSMYVSVDQNCFLDIKLELNGENITRTVRGFNKIDSSKIWQRIEIQVSSVGNGKLSFYRGSTQTGFTTGYWAVDDITLCSGDTKVNQMVIEDKTLNEYTCKTLKKSSAINTDYIHLCKNPGYLGKNCNISCSDVLGETSVYCEKYKICQDGSCHCSWGYEGTFCEKPCSGRTWGLFCANQCESECFDCHRSTGECLNSSFYDAAVQNLPESIINVEVPEAPENLDIKWVSVHEAILTWEHPNGLLKEFEVEVESEGVTENYLIPVEIPEKVYQLTIPINYNIQYSINIWASSGSAGARSDLSALFLPPNPALSSRASVETCSTSCYLLIPKPENLESYRGYDIVLLYGDETKDNIIENFKKCRSNSGTDIKGSLVTEIEDHDEKHFRIKIEEAPQKGLSILKDKDCYLILSNNTEQYVVYSITQNQKLHLNVAMASLLILAISMGLLLLLLSFYRKSLLRRSTVIVLETKQNSNGSTKDGVLLLPGHKSVTKISTHHIIHYLKNVLRSGSGSLPVSTRPTVHGFAYRNINKSRNQIYIP